MNTTKFVTASPSVMEIKIGIDKNTTDSDWQFYLESVFFTSLYILGYIDKRKST